MGWGPPRDLSGFESAALVDDGKAVVFSYQRVVYRPATGLRAFPDGGPAKYIKDTRCIGLWDLGTGKVRILATYKNNGKRLLPGTWDMHIDKASGRKVIIRKSGQKKADYMFETDTFWMNLENGKLSPLPIDKTLSSKRQDLDFYYLVDGEGTLVLVSHEIGKEPEGKYEKIRNLQVILPDGEVVAIGRFIHYYGFLRGALHYYTPDNDYRIFGLETRTSRVGSREEYLEIMGHIQKKPEVGIRIEKSNLQGKSLILSRKVLDGTYEDTAVLDYHAVDQLVR